MDLKLEKIQLIVSIILCILVIKDYHKKVEIHNKLIETTRLLIEVETKLNLKGE